MAYTFFKKLFLFVFNCSMQLHSVKNDKKTSLNFQSKSQNQIGNYKLGVLRFLITKTSTQIKREEKLEHEG